MFMRLLVGVSALGLALSGSGCARIKINSTVNLMAAPVVERVLVVADITNHAFNQEMYRGFERGMRAGFTACNVKNDVMQVYELEVDPTDRFAKARTRLQPDSVLLIRADGGTYYIGEYGDRVDLFFKMDLSRANKLHTPYWRAKSQLNAATRNMYGTDTQTGELFAHAIIERLQKDGVLKGCKAQEPAPPNKSVSGFDVNDA